MILSGKLKKSNKGNFMIKTKGLTLLSFFLITLSFHTPVFGAKNNEDSYFSTVKKKAIGISKPIAKYTKYAKSVRRFHRASANVTRPFIGELSFDLIDNFLTGLTYINRGATAVTVLGEGKPGAIGALTIEYTQDYLLDYAANYIGSSNKPDEINNLPTTNEKFPEVNFIAPVENMLMQEEDVCPNPDWPYRSVTVNR